jgi:hypothetical protein
MGYRGGMIDDMRGQEPTEPTLMDDGVERDLELQTLARIVDGILDEMGITVVTGGTVISGRLVGPERWHELLHETGASAGENAEAVLSGLRKMQRDEDDPRELVSYSYLHLVDSHILTSAGMAGGQFMWRIRISEVSAWTLQEWTPNAPE